MNLDSAFARRWFDDVLTSLTDARELINALNVFPVPDADTGTNVVQTLKAGARAAKDLPDSAPVDQYARVFADGALRGARGNSGIIVAQSFQAVAVAFEGAQAVEPVVLVRAFDAIALGARRALAAPVEGTIVTVAQDVADAVLLLPPPLTIRGVVSTALTAATESLERTTILLPALLETGQVDAGALCYVMLITALARAVGIPTVEKPKWFVVGVRTGMSEEERSDFEVMYLVHASHRDATVLRTRLNEIGNSVVVVGGKDQLWHVHVHLSHPAAALSGLPMSQVVVRTLDPSHRGLVAATSAPHLLEPLAAAGAVAVLDANEHTFLRAAQDAAANEVLILPCSNESAAAAQRSLSHAAEDGITATLGATRDDLGVYEAAALHAVGAGVELDSERRVYRIDGLDPAAITSGVEAAARALVAAHPAVITVLVGAALNAHQAARHLTALVRAGSPETETYVIPGGQEAPALLVSAV